MLSPVTVSSGFEVQETAIAYFCALFELVQDSLIG
jgi:hypothetical protein